MFDHLLSVWRRGRASFGDGNEETLFCLAQAALYAAGWLYIDDDGEYQMNVNTAPASEAK